MTSSLLTIVAIDKTHDVASFESSSPDLNEFLRRYARQNEKKGGSRTYVAIENNRVVGYYSLAAGHVLHELAADGLKAGLGKTPIPVLLLARLAVDGTHLGKGLGARLLKDALLRALSASQSIGIRAVIVHAKDDVARSFYEHFGFEPMPGNRLHLFVLIKDISIQT